MIHELKRSVLERELNKAFCDFSGIEPHVHVRQCDDGRVATGHWGCGAFGGHKQAKALIQLMAAAQAGKALVYHDVDGEVNERTLFLQELEAFVSLLIQMNVTVAQLYSVMLKVGETYYTSDESCNLFKVCSTIFRNNTNPACV